MSRIDLDTKYSNLIDELTNLTGKLNTFIHGDAATTISTNSGVIKSLAGLVADLKKYRYTQKVIDHRTYANMMGDRFNIEDGLLIRVWGDTPELNGLYMKESEYDVVKLSYQDLLDILPIP